MSSGPPVSIVVAGYNAEDFIGTGTASVLAQTFRDFELIVVDDGSSDRAARMAEYYARADQRVRAVTYSANRSRGHARNVGIGTVRGRWVTCIDADDWYAPDLIQTLTDIAERNAGSAVADNQVFFDEVKKRPFRLLVAERSQEYLTMNSVLLLDSDNVVGDSSIGLVKLFVEKSLIRESSIDFSEINGFGEDFIFHIFVHFSCKGAHTRKSSVLQLENSCQFVENHTGYQSIFPGIDDLQTAHRLVVTEWRRRLHGHYAIARAHHLPTHEVSSDHCADEAGQLREIG